MDIIVDGYNVIGAGGGLHGALEHKRNRLIQQAVAYQRHKRFNLVLVFDGWRSGRSRETIEKHDTVAVVYSRLGEKADSVIIRLAREKGAGCVVVTSDREIGKAVERFGAVMIPAGEFNAILRSVERGGDCEYNDQEKFDVDARAPAKRNRASKSDRRREEKLRKLRP